MKRLVGFAGLAVLLLAAVPMASAGTMGFDFANTGNGSGINFASGNFSFLGNFAITGQAGTGWPNGTLLSGLQGSISGSYTIGAITISGPLQMASVTGAGVLSIVTGSGTFTADVQWVDIATFGTAGSINTQGTVNLSNISYSGTNADLIALVNSIGPTATITFQSVVPKTLTQLKAGLDLLTSYSGSAAAETGSVPVSEPSTLLLLGSGLLGIAAWRFKK